MDQRGSGIILRTRPLTETSLIVQWLDAAHGRISTVAKGARRPKSPYAGKLDLFHSAHFSFKSALRSELHTLREVELTNGRPGLRTNYPALVQAAYAVTFIEQMTETGTPLPEIHDLLTDFLDHLSGTPTQPRNVYAFEVRFLALIGLDVDATGLPPGSGALLESLREDAWAELALLRPPSTAIRGLQRFLGSFIHHHCQRIPRGREEALTVRLEEAPGTPSTALDSARLGLV